MEIVFRSEFPYILNANISCICLFFYVCVFTGILPTPGATRTPAINIGGFIGIVDIIVEREEREEREEEAAPAPIIEIGFDNGLERGFKFGATAPTVTLGIDCDNCCGNGFDNGCDNDLFEYGATAPAVTDICFEKGEREREREHGFEFGATAPAVTTGIGNGCDNGLFEYGLEYGLEAPYYAFFTTILFVYCDNIIAGLTATTVTTVAAVTRTEKESEKENNGVTFTPNATNVEEGKEKGKERKGFEFGEVVEKCFVCFLVIVFCMLSSIL